MSVHSHSELTKAGIERARASGARWGAHGLILARRNRDKAQAFAENLYPTILQLLLDNNSLKHPGPGAIARKLNYLGVPTVRGGIWHPTTVRRLLGRLNPKLREDLRVADERALKKMLGLKEVPDLPSLLLGLLK